MKDSQQRNTTRPVTIRDVAERAGVSHQTVSRFLRFDGAGVREAYRDRIRSAISELGYQPNLAARAMRTRHTGQLAILLPEGQAISTVDVLHGATATARAAGFTVDVVALGGEPEQRRQRARDLLGSGLFEGVLALTPLGLATPAPSAPTVVEFPLYDDDLHGTGQLAEATAIDEIVDGLARDGHRRFLHLAGSYAHESARNRRDAYLCAVSRLGLEDHGVVECQWDPARAMQAIADLPDDSPVTAVIAANDPLALGAIRGASSHGWSVPGHLSVAGFDTDVLAAWMSPSLTSVAIDHAELGRRASTALLDALGVALPHGIDAPAMAVVRRESTAAPRP